MDEDENFAAYASTAWAGLVRAAVVLGCAPEEADDLAQTVLVKCFVAWQKVQAADNRDAYVYRVLLNAHRDRRRRRWWTEQPRPDLFDTARRPAEDGSDLQTQVAIADAIRRALADLPDAHRQTVVLRYFAHLSEAETARVLGIAPGTVKSRLSRALRALAVNDHLLDHVEGTPHGTS